MKRTRIEYLCDNCGALIEDGAPVYMVQESRAVISKEIAEIVPITVKPAMICEQCFEAMMQRTHEPQNDVSAPTKDPDPVPINPDIPEKKSVIAEENPEITREAGPNPELSEAVVMVQKPKQVSDEMLREAWELRAQGKSCSYIAREIGISTYRTQKLLETMPQEYEDRDLKSQQGERK